MQTTLEPENGNTPNNSCVLEDSCTLESDGTVKSSNTQIAELGCLLVERYIVTDLLAQNAYFQLMRAHDLRATELGGEISRSVLIVLFQASQASENERTISKIFEQACCQHTFLVTVLDVIYDRTHCGVVLVDNKGQLLSLWQRQRSSSCDYQQMMTIAKQLSSGLQVLHAEKCVHGCLTPDHIVVNNTDVAQIWGAGFHDKAELDAMPSTFEPYITPNVRNGHKSSVQDDLFSLGTILYQLFSGQVFFSNNSVDNSQHKQPRQLSFWQWHLLKQLMTSKTSERWSHSLSLWTKLFTSARYWTIYLCMVVACITVLATMVSITSGGQQHDQLLVQAEAYQRKKAVEKEIHHIAALPFSDQLTKLQALKAQAHPDYSDIVQRLYVSLIKPTAINVDFAIRQDALPNYAALNQALTSLYLLFPNDYWLLAIEQQLWNDYQQRRVQLIAEYQRIWESVDFIRLSPDTVPRFSEQAQYLSQALPNQPEIRLSVSVDHPAIARYRQHLTRAIKDRHPQHLYQLWQWSQVLNHPALYAEWEKPKTKVWLRAASEWYKTTRQHTIDTWPPLVMEYFIQPRITAWERYLRRRKTPAQIKEIQQEWLDDIAHLQLLSSTFYQKRHAEFIQEVEARMKTYRWGEKRVAWRTLLRVLREQGVDIQSE